MHQRESRQRLHYVSSICVTPAKKAFLSSLIVDYPLVWQAPFTCVTGLVHLCAMTHAYVCHDSYMWHGSFICVPSLVHVCHDSFIRTTWLISMWDMTHLLVTWLIHMCDVPHSNRTSRFLVIKFRPHQHPLRWVFSGLVQEKQGSLMEVYVKRGVRGVSSAISAFVGR